MVAALLCSYLLLLAAVGLPFVQRGVSAAIAQSLARRLGTEVSVGNTQIGLFNYLILSDVEIKDQKGRPLLEAKKMSAKVRLRSLLSPPITIRTIELYRADVNVVRDAGAKAYNFQFVIDSLSNTGEPNKPATELKIKSLILNDCRLSYDDNNSPRLGSFDIAHSRLHDFDLGVGLSLHKDGRVAVRLRNIAFRENSGLTVTGGYAVGTVGKQGVEIADAQVEMPESRVRIADVVLARGAGGRLSGKAGLRRSTVALRDLRPLLPKAKLPGRIFTAEGSCTIVDGLVKAPDIRLSEQRGELKVRAAIEYGGPKRIALQLRECRVGEALLHEALDLANLRSSYARYLANLGDINVVGRLARRGDVDAADVHFEADAGNVVAEYRRRGAGVSATVKQADIQLGRLLANPEWGRVAFKGSYQGDGAAAFAANVDVESAQFRKYNYSKISASLRRRGAVYEAGLNSSDPNALVSARATVEKEGRAVATYSADAQIDKLSLAGLQLLAKAGGISEVAGRVSVKARGENWDDFSGTVTVDGLTAAKRDSVFHLGKLALNVDDSDKGKGVVLKGDFGEVGMNGRFDFKTLSADLLQILNGPQKSDTPTDRNIFNFYAKLTDASLLNFLTDKSVAISNGGNISGFLNSREQNFLLEAVVPKIDYGSSRFSDLTLYAKGSRENVQARFHTLRALADGTLEIESSAKTKGADLENTVLWKSTAEHRNSGELEQTITFPENTRGAIESIVRQSKIVVDDSVWNIHPAHLAYEGGKLHIDGLRITHGENELMLDGILSSSAADSLRVRLRNIRIKNLLDLVSFDDVEFDGHATGDMIVASALESPRVNANIGVGDFIFNRAAMGRLSLQSNWNSDERRIDINALIRDGASYSTGISGFVNPADQTIDIRFLAKGTNALFLNPFFPDAVQFSQARTSGDFRLFGSLHAMNLEGHQVISDMRVDVSAIGTNYSAATDTVVFSPNVISFPHFELTDMYGNHAVLTGKVMHHALHDFSYDLNIDANDFWAFEQKRDSKSSFWGTAIIDGNVHIHGQPGSFTADVNATPRRGTVFVYNADRPDGTDNVELLSFRDADRRLSAESPDSVATTAADALLPGFDVGSDIWLNLNLDVTPDAELGVLMDSKGESRITTHGSGNINAHYYNKGNFGMFGTYTVSDGIYNMKIQELIQKQFTMSEGGRIVFDGDPLAGTLNFKAVYTIPSVSLSGISSQGNLRDASVPVDCVMNITGSARQPMISFDIDMPSVSADQKQMVRSLIATQEDMNMQAMYLLSVGRFYTYNYDMASAPQGQSQASLAMNSFVSTTLSANINNLIHSINEHKSNWSFGTNLATGNDGWNDMDVEGLFTGRLMRGRLLIDGNLGYRDRSAYNSNFVGDFSARYLLNPRGTIQLKAYNESNDRYFTKSSLNTQGGGIVFQKDFTKVRDIFKKKSPKSGRKAKKK